MFPISPLVWADPVYRTDAEALLAVREPAIGGSPHLQAVVALWGRPQRWSTL